FTEGLFAHRGNAEEFSPYLGYGIALAVGWLGWLVSYRLYYKRGLAGDEKLSGAWRRLLANKFYVDEFYGWLVVRPLWAFARGLWRIVDATIIDGLFVNGVAAVVAWIGAIARRFQNGNVQRYAAVTAVGVAALIYVFLVRG
ncbi:MAG TPA: NADH-quinone oxidoreductase subunit L, partial [Myxococcales bacterium]|nr:NADH-quinone oxidoreductase subunit L [Myxococcales bacterium]